MITTDLVIEKMNSIADQETGQPAVDMVEPPEDSAGPTGVDRDLDRPIPETHEVPIDFNPLENQEEEHTNGEDNDQISDIAVEVQSATNEKNEKIEEVSADRQVRKSARIIAKRRHGVFYAFHTLSVKQGINEYGDNAIDSIKKELKQLLVDKKAMHPVHRNALTKTQLKKVIRSLLFLKSKHDAEGTFQKLKSRLVANGSQQLKSLYGDVSSPTASLASLMMVLNVAAAEKRKAAVIDIGGAYLNAKMTGEVVHMELNPLLTKLLVQIDASVKPYVDDKGKLVVQLDKALYGCVQSAKLWYDTLTKALKKMGYVPNEVDQCVFNKGTGESMCTIVLFVDDILALSRDTEELQKLIEGLKDEFKEVSAEITSDFSYLGMHIRMLDDGIHVSMEGYIDELMSEYGITKGAKTPSTENLFKIGDGEALDSNELSKFHTNVAKLLYLAMRVRPETLVAVAFLCTRVHCATTVDQKKLQRVMEYVYATGTERGIVIKGKNIDQVRGMIDAAFAQHSDGKSHSGMAVMMGDTCVMVKSSKQKLVSKDSTEAELIALSDMLKYVDKCNAFMEGQGVKMKTPMLCQDNMSTISMVTKGGGKWRSKYMKVRKESVLERVRQGDFRVEYVPTESMIADVLTKPLGGSLFARMTKMIRGGAEACKVGRGAFEQV